jgi:hypothetical protein
MADYELLASSTLEGGSVASIAITSIPQTYDKLIIFGFAKLSVNNVRVDIDLNGDTISSAAGAFGVSRNGSNTWQGVADNSTARLFQCGFFFNNYNSFMATITNYTDANPKAVIHKAITGGTNTTTGTRTARWGSKQFTSGAITQVRMEPTSGNITDGYLFVYGVR